MHVCASSGLGPYRRSAIGTRVSARRFPNAGRDMDARAHGAGGAPWHKRRCANGQSAIGSQAPMGASLEHLVQRSIANPAIPADHLASLDTSVVQAYEPARAMTRGREPVLKPRAKGRRGTQKEWDRHLSCHFEVLIPKFVGQDYFIDMFKQAGTKRGVNAKGGIPNHSR